MRDQKSCPSCGRYLSESALSCQCGYSFSEGRAGAWKEDLNKVHFPSTLAAWALIVGAAPITAVVYRFLIWLDWFDLYHISATLLLFMLFVLPVGLHMLPTTRKKHGGCCLGCMIWAVMGVTIGWVSSRWSFEDPVRTREVAPIARFDQSMPGEIGGVRLGQSIEEVESQLKKVEEALVPFCPSANKSLTVRYEGGAEVTYADGVVMRVRGKSLGQNGKVLLESGQPPERIMHLFSTSSFANLKRIQKVGDAQYWFYQKGGKLTDVVVQYQNISVVYKKSRQTVNGIALGTARDELPRGEQLAPRTEKQGEATVEYDELGRVVQISGTRFEIAGKEIIKSGDSIGKLRRLRPSSKRGVYNYGAAQATFKPGKNQSIHGVTLRYRDNL